MNKRKISDVAIIIILALPIIYFLLWIQVNKTPLPAGNADKVVLMQKESNIFTEQVFNDAVECIKKYFKKSFTNCELRELRYAGDDLSQRGLEPDSDYDIIWFFSSFYVKRTPFLHQNDDWQEGTTHDGYQFILERRKGTDDWTVRSTGYG